jgi:hypothetical protein
MPTEVPDHILDVLGQMADLMKANRPAHELRPLLDKLQQLQASSEHGVFNVAVVDSSHSWDEATASVRFGMESSASYVAPPETILDGLAADFPWLAEKCAELRDSIAALRPDVRAGLVRHMIAWLISEGAKALETAVAHIDKLVK